MILKIRKHIDTGSERIKEDYFVENPKELTVSIARPYSLGLQKEKDIQALFPLSEEECLCHFISYYLDGEFHLYAAWPDSIFIMNDNGKTIDRY